MYRTDLLCSPPSRTSSKRESPPSHLRVYRAGTDARYIYSGLMKGFKSAFVPIPSTPPLESPTDASTRNQFVQCSLDPSDGDSTGRIIARQEQSCLGCKTSVAESLSLLPH